jgi:hypothetical protein
LEFINTKPQTHLKPKLTLFLFCLVVLGFDLKDPEFKPDVWLTAYPAPYQAKTLTLSE